MRIIRGSHRGRQIQPPKSLPVRPTTDYAKEGLFNVLEHTFEFGQIEVLDLFSGTGSISYEFASRGCQKIVAVDANQRCTRFISKTANELGFGNLKVIRSDVFRFLSTNKQPFGLVFADPPYDLESIDRLPGLILNGNILHDTAWFILEHPGKYDFSSHPFFLKHRKYGEVNFSFFEFSGSLKPED